jgi:hypothetical protein
MTAGNAKNGHELPRLSIAHLLLLTLTCSICLAVVAPAIHRVWRMPDDAFRGSRIPAIIVLALDQSAIGIKLFGVAVLIRAYIVSGNWKLAPGHWYFLATAPLVVSSLASELIPARLQAEHSILYHLSRDAFCLGAAAIGVAALCAVDSWPWRICLALSTASALTLSFLFTYRAAEVFGYARSTYRLHAISLWGTLDIGVLVTALIAVAIDLARSNRRDWLHYFAVLAMLPTAASIVGAFGPLIGRWWTDLYRFITG